MQLSQFTDFGLRVLIYLAQRPGGNPATITELSSQFNISRNHLVKIIQFLSKHQVLDAQRGRKGGLRLAHASDELRIGNLVKLLERKNELFDCRIAPCFLFGHCVFKDVMEKAHADFFKSLNQYTLTDLVQSPAKERLAHAYSLIS